MEDKPMGVNFFGWIRDGVKQSVLLGVSDAIEQLGTPPDAGEASPQVLAFLRNETPPQRITATTPMPNSAPNNPAARNRKRLGRSLKEIDGTS